MADLGDALYRAICRRSPATEPNSFRDAVGWFVANAGGNVSAAARAAGVSRRTFRDWLEGKGHGTARAGDVLAAARAGERRKRLRPGREKRLRAMDPSGMQVHGAYNYDPKVGGRTVDAGRYVAPGVMGELLDAFLSGASLAELRQTFADNMLDPSGFYPTTFALSSENPHGWDVSSVDLEGDGDES